MISTRRGPLQIVQGAGVASAIAPIVCQWGRRGLVVTDSIISQQSMYKSIINSIVCEDVDVLEFVNTVSDVPLAIVDDLLEQAATYDPDFIVAIGGGTVIDLAKMCGVLLKHGGTPRDYYGENLVPGPIVPLVAVPTTAGTGSEVTSVAVLSDKDRELKVGVSSTYMIPMFAVCDPELTHSCPASVTAFAGIDAVCHAVESFTAAERTVKVRDLVDEVFIGKNSLSDRHALTAMGLLGPNLAKVVEDGSNAVARAAVMRGATEAGLAFGHSGTGAPHALQYPVGAGTGTPHGLGVGLLLPYVLTATQSLISDELLALGSSVGLAGNGSPDAFIEWVVELNQRIGIPATLKDIGVVRSDLRHYAELATGVVRILRNNRGDNSVEGLESVLNAAFEGDFRLLR